MSLVAPNSVSITASPVRAARPTACANTVLSAVSHPAGDPVVDSLRQ